MRHNLIVAYSTGYEGLNVYDMHHALTEAQEEKNRKYYWNPFDTDGYSTNREGTLHTYCIEDGVEIDMRAMKISDMKSDVHGNFIRLYLPKDRL